MSLRKIQLVAVILAIYGVYNVWMVVKYGQPLFLLWMIACFLSSAGLWLQKPWSRFVVYVIGSLTIFGLLLYVLSMTFLNAWPYLGVAKTVLALTAGALVVAVCVWSMIVTYRFFRAAK
jgi:hypothetical protein